MVDIISKVFPLMVEDICSIMYMGTSLKFRESMFLSGLWVVGLMIIAVLKQVPFDFESNSWFLSCVSGFVKLVRTNFVLWTITVILQTATYYNKFCDINDMGNLSIASWHDARNLVRYYVKAAMYVVLLCIKDLEF
ncbi:unnamed protein product [Fraxinus pennsylvanica]|uniref:Uncharacterized protein n=1 Tax=Fraxinus pennsylvanica TaxID=56036 RepID=A0AAD2DQV4_9LAMI|nr:unnamed protein product [Fraxinus pennsylvanica]